MSLVRLRTFVEVYRQRSISGAARMLNLTQPAVSQHIAGLEISVGRPLFERLVNGMSPTAAADELAADIGDKLDAVEAALASARARSRDVAGALQLIGHADFMAEKLSPELAPLLDAGIRIRMHTGDGPMVTQMLLEGHCELGISAHPVTDSRLSSELILTDKVIAVAAPSVVNRIERATDFASSLLKEPLLAYNLELSLVEAWLKRNRIDSVGVTPAMVGQDMRAHRSLLAQGVGWSVMPRFFCERQLLTGELQVIPAPKSQTEIHYYLIWLPSTLRQPRVAHARQTLLWRFKQHVE